MSAERRTRKREGDPWWILSPGGVAGVTIASMLLLLAVYLPGEDAAVGKAPAFATSAVRVALSPEESSIDVDHLAWTDARLARNDSDELALSMALDARLRRFRATGNAAELTEAEALLARLGGTQAAPAAATALALAVHDFPGAVAASRTAVFAADPGDPDAVLGRFDALWASGRYQDAAEMLPELGDRPASAGWLARKARLEDGRGDVHAARDLMDRAVDLVDAYAESGVVRAWARVEAGHFAAHSGDPRDAVDSYVEALEIVPGYPAALEGLAWIAYGVDEDLDLARTLFERALAAGAHQDVRLTLAEVLRARGLEDEAAREERAFLEAATASDRDRRMHLRPLALHLAERLDRLEEALAHAERDLELRADRMAWAVRGLILARMGRADEALDDAQRALAWGSPEPSVLEVVGRIHLATGRSDMGRRLLREALEGSSELGPVVVSEIERLLESG